MTHPTPTDPDAPQNPRDYGVSLIRTYMPLVWGWLLTWLASRAPGLRDFLDSEMVYGTAVLAVSALWYALWRLVERVLPPMLTRLVLGANRRPAYGPTVPGEVVATRPAVPYQAEGR